MRARYTPSVYACCVRKDMGKRLAEGISARLEYDYVCERGHSFGEYHLHGVMNEIISAVIDPGVFVPHAGYAHPAIATLGEPKRGRPREVDFYVEPRESDKPSTCIEAKWAGSSHCTWERVLLDLCRLTLVKHHSPTTECLFVLAGGARDVNALVRRMPVAQGRRVLQIPAENKNSRLHSYPIMDWAGRFVVPAVVRDGLPTIPRKLHSTLVKSAGTNTSKWQTIVWRIGPPALWKGMAANIP